MTPHKASSFTRDTVNGTNLLTLHFNSSSFCFLGPIDRVSEARQFSRSPISCLPRGCRSILRQLETVDTLRTSEQVQPTLSSFVWFGSSGNSQRVLKNGVYDRFGNVSSRKHCITCTKNSLSETPIQCIYLSGSYFPQKCLLWEMCLLSISQAK